MVLRVAQRVNQRVGHVRAGDVAGGTIATPRAHRRVTFGDAGDVGHMQVPHQVAGHLREPCRPLNDELGWTALDVEAPLLVTADETLIEHGLREPAVGVHPPRVLGLQPQTTRRQLAVDGLTVGAHQRRGAVVKVDVTV